MVEYPVLYNIGKVSVYGFVLVSMFVTGLNVTLSDLMAPIKNRRLIGVSLFSNFILVPLLALALIYLTKMETGLASGLLLCAIAAGAPSIGKIAQLSGANVARAVSLTILLTIATIILTPFLVPYVLPGGQANPLYVTGYLVVLILIPIFAGMWLQSRKSELAGRVLPKAELLSWICIALIFLTYGLIFLSKIRDIVTSSSGLFTILIAIVFTLAALGIGYAMAGLVERESKMEIAFGTGFRNITAALVVIFALPEINSDALLMILMVTVFAVIIVSIIVGLMLKKRMDAEKKAKGTGA
jgi:predicted Na+-dependent transporter